jgi:hypothetical protein
MPSYILSEPYKQRVDNALATVEGMPSQQKTTLIQTRFETLQQPAGGKTFRVCTFTGAWSINASKTVTFRGVTSTPNTVSAINLVCGLNPSGSCDVSIAKDGTAWYLVQPNLTQQPGYSGSGTQVLTIQNGSLAWVGTTAC